MGNHLCDVTKGQAAQYLSTLGQFHNMYKEKLSVNRYRGYKMLLVTKNSQKHMVTTTIFADVTSLSLYPTPDE